MQLSSHQCYAAYPRSSPKATISPCDRLQIVYLKYQRSAAELAKLTKSGKKAVNLVFVHGATFNKHCWQYYAEQMYAQDSPDWFLNRAIMYDAVNHGDSAILNQHKLGTESMWRDNARDIIELVVHEGLHTDGTLVVVGHSFGGFSAITAGHWFSSKIDSVFVIDPVLVIRPAMKKHINEMPPEYRTHVMRKYASIEMKDHFADLEEYYEFWRKSFRGVYDERIFKLLADNDYVVKSDGTIAPKMSVEQQLLSYAGAFAADSEFADIAPYLCSPITYVVGKKNLASKPLVHKVMKRSLGDKLKYIDTQISGHGIFAEQPDLMIELLNKHVAARVAPVSCPDLSTEQRDKAFEKMYAHVVDGNYGVTAQKSKL